MADMKLSKKVKRSAGRRIMTAPKAGKNRPYHMVSEPQKNGPRRWRAATKAEAMEKTAKFGGGHPEKRHEKPPVMWWQSSTHIVQRGYE